jgi:deazaflavin-dependent oxidoreductase (nitroreductase family)
MSSTAPASQTRYVVPGGFTRRVFNPLIRRLTRWGLSIRGSRELAVRGRKTGEWKRVPVNPLDLDGHRYLVAPRGTTQWVRNLRVAKAGELRVGRRVEVFRAVEVADAEKVAILRSYLERWKMEVGVFFDGVGPDAPDEAIAAIAPGYPVFEIQAA